VFRNGYGRLRSCVSVQPPAPLGMAIAPNGDVIVMNGNDGNAVDVVS
jgi:hypothetical protein